MISAFLFQGTLHAVHVVARSGLTKIAVTALCAAAGDAGDGIYQVPTWAFDGRTSYATATACGECGKRLRAMMTAPKGDGS